MAILLESSLFFRVNLLRCLRMRDRCPEDGLPAVKCPKCGFVSNAGLEQCKKCGHSFATATREGVVSLRASFFPEGGRSMTNPSPQPPPESKESPPFARPEMPPEPAPPADVGPWPVPSHQEKLDGADYPPADEPPQDWREELSERLENYRKRRARLQPDADPEGNLELNF